jgi:hypothetical protein
VSCAHWTGVVDDDLYRLRILFPEEYKGEWETGHVEIRALAGCEQRNRWELEYILGLDCA